MSLPFENSTDVSFLKNIEEERIPHVDVDPDILEEMLTAQREQEKKEAEKKSFQIKDKSNLKHNLLSNDVYNTTVNGYVLVNFKDLKSILEQLKIEKDLNTSLRQQVTNSDLMKANAVINEQKQQINELQKEIGKYKVYIDKLRETEIKQVTNTVQRQRPLNRQEVMERNQARVIALYLKGYKPKDIVNQLQISQATVYRALELEKVEIERLHKKYVNEFAGVDYSLVRNWSSIKAKKAKK